MPNPEALELPDELLVVGGAVRLGLFDILAKRELALKDLALELKADLRALDMLVFALEGYGYVHYGDKIRLTDEAREMFYDSDSIRYTGFTFMHVYNRVQNWLHIPETVRSGSPPPREHSVKKLGSFMESLQVYAREVAPKVVRACLKGVKLPIRMLDVGGGPLNYAPAFAREGAEVTVLDTPEVVEFMRPRVPEGLPIRMVPGDFNEGLPEGPFGLVFLSNISHIYGRDENEKLIARSGRALAPGGRLVISDYVRGISAHAPYMAVNMLMSTRTGGVWTQDEYSEWLAAAGFSVPEIINIDQRQLIIAHKA